MFKWLRWWVFEWAFFALNKTIGLIAAAATFVGCWIYAVDSWGAFLGIAFGWIPAAIIAATAGVLTALLWPLAALSAAGVFIYSLPSPGRPGEHRVPGYTQSPNP